MHWKAALEGQKVTEVLVAEKDVETLKSEVYEYTQELWRQAIATMQHRLFLSVEKVKCWFEATGEEPVLIENTELQNTIAELRSELEAERGKGVPNNTNNRGDARESRG